MAGLVEQARRTFLSEGGWHSIQIDLPLDLRGVMADRERVVPVLNNLFSNAGRGVPPDLLPHLFRKHARVGGDGERGIRGSGLGLAIGKGLVEAHGGRIRAESGGPGLGTRFTFTLLVTDGAPTGAAGSLARSPGGSTRRETERTCVLVVDDDPQVLKYVRDALEAPGYSTVSTVDPQEVPHLLRTHRPQLVVMDLLMPGIDSIELMEQVPELGDLTVHYEERRVTVDDRPVALTAKEFDLLRALSAKAGWASTYESLLRRVWSGRDKADLRLLRTYVKRLRRKLGDDAGTSAYIVNERQVGYRMARPDDSAPSRPVSERSRTSDN